MKLKITFLILSLGFSCLIHSQEDMEITWDYRNMSFHEFVSNAENVYNLRFFFREEWVADLKPGDFPGISSLTDLLDNLFRDRSLFYYIDESRNVVITKNFAVKGVRSTQAGDQDYIAPTEYYDPRDIQKAAGHLVVDIGNPADRYKTGNVTISGYISDRDSKNPVAGATVYVQQLSVGTTSNQYGFYSLSLPRGVHILQFSFIGMKEQQVNVNLYGTGEMNIDMNSMLIPLRETTVSAQKNVLFQRYESGVQKVDITTFKLLPTSMGESDILKSVLLIPGVQSVGEGSAGFNVRGGSSDQNLILLYGAPVYNSSHFFGFFSAVNSDIIRDVTLFKGGIPGRYGGRISSVLDIESKDGNRKEFKGNAGISPITTHLMLEGPLIRDTLTFILTGRTTYSNWVLDFIDNDYLKKSRATFYDLNGRITYDLNKNNKLELSAYLSHDSFRLNSDTVYSYNNRIIAARWRHFFNSRFFSQVSVNNSNYDYNVTSESSPVEAFRLTRQINSTNFKADFNWYQGRNEFNFGIDLSNHQVLPGNYLPSGDSSLVIPRKINRERGFETAVYFEDKFVLTDYLSVNAGLRFSSFFAAGPALFPVYDPEYSKARSTIIDTIHFKSSSIYKTFAGPELRLSLNFRTGTTSSLKINYNKTRQYLHLLSNTISISPIDTWKLSDYYLKPQTGHQLAVGFYQMLFSNRIETSVELYYKRILNMLDYKGGTDLTMPENIERDLVPVRGKAYGIELAIKRDEGRIRWNIGYTYSRTFLRSTGKFSDEIINNGSWFPSNFDKPHDLVATFNFLLSRRFSLSTNYTYSTGRPITYPVATYFQDDMLLVHYSDRNKYRIPDYARLDISFKVSGNLRSRKIANPHWIFSVYNMLGRQNAYSVYFKNENKTVYGYKLSVFGKAIPSVSFNFDF